MDNCLMIGNGLNRCLKYSISWGSLLEEISNYLDVDYNRDITMPLEYERIINSYLKTHPDKNDSIYLETKTIIAKRLSCVLLPQNSIHKRITEININAILTTNYDFLLEYVYNSEYKDIGSQHKYLAEATSTQNDVKFYHPHGIVSRKTSLCLGYEHYMGIVEKIRRALNRKENNKNEKMLIKQRLHGALPLENTWYERFYTSNIAIIGLALTECEVDIWWLLTHRAFLYYSNYCDLKKMIKNNIVYYDIINDVSIEDTKEEDNRKKNLLSQHNRHILLRNEHVIVHRYELSKYNGSYIEAYNAMINDIKRDGIVLFFEYCCGQAFCNSCG